MNIIKYSAIVLIALLTTTIGCQKQEDAAHEEDNHGEAHEEGGTTVHLDKHKVFHAGLRVERVEKKSIAVPLTLSGKVVFNERKMAHISARVKGRLEKVNVYTNDKVKAGDVLAELYSDEYNAIQFEYLQALQRWRRGQARTEDESTSRSIYESSRRRLSVAGATEEEIKKLEETGIPEPFYFVRAPFSGTILESSERPGSFVEAGAELFDIADLSVLWVLADIYERDVAYVREGLKANVEIAGFSGSFHGTVSSIYSVVDEKTRTVKARIEIPGHGGKLKPEMYCTVKVETEMGKATIKVPASALLGETEKHFVFVALNDTTFERRDIRTGVETREFAEVLDGLLEGELIVVKGGFFLKSELAKETFGEEH